MKHKINKLELQIGLGSGCQACFCSRGTEPPLVRVGMQGWTPQLRETQSPVPRFPSPRRFLLFVVDWGAGLEVELLLAERSPTELPFQSLKSFLIWGLVEMLAKIVPSPWNPVIGICHIPGLTGFIWGLRHTHWTQKLSRASTLRRTLSSKRALLKWSG